MRFLRDTTGATSIEYALIAGTIFLAVVAAFPAVATGVGVLFGRVLQGFQ